MLVLSGNNMEVPQSLRTWFVIHFIVDFIFGIPLLLFPAYTLSLFGFEAAELLTARLVGAALLGIGGVSFLVLNESAAVFRSLLKLKIIWSLSAIVAIGLTLVEGAPVLTWVVLWIFVVFSALWMYYLRRV